MTHTFKPVSDRIHMRLTHDADSKIIIVRGLEVGSKNDFGIYEIIDAGCKVDLESIGCKRGDTVALASVQPHPCLPDDEGTAYIHDIIGLMSKGEEDAHTGGPVTDSPDAATAPDPDTQGVG